MSKLTPRTRFALELIRDKPGLASPGRFADAFWPADFHGADGTRLHAQRNKAGGVMSAWWAAGYLGRLRKAGWITGGEWESNRHVGFYRTPLRLTEKALEALKS